MDGEDKANVDFEQFYLSNNMLIIYYMIWYFKAFLLHISFQTSHSWLLFL